MHSQKLLTKQKVWLQTGVDIFLILSFTGTSILTSKQIQQETSSDFSFSRLLSLFKNNGWAIVSNILCYWVVMFYL